MVHFHFQKYKYGKELLVDCFDLSEIPGQSIAMKESHATSFYEIFFFLKGSGAMILDGQKLNFKSPSVLLLPPARPRQWIINSIPECVMVIFEGEFMEAFLKDHLFLNRLYFFGNYDSPPLLPLSKQSLQYFPELLLQIKNEIRNLSEDSHELLRAYLYQLLIVLNRKYTAHYNLKGNLYRNTEMLKFKNLLKQHIQEKQKVSEYANLLGINRNRINQLCKEVFGKDAHVIIREHLLLACKNELLATSKTIAEISYNYNFSAPSNFVRFFKSMTNLSPASYREQYAN
jgi:AraC family transcriptional regulator, transcriptional activator of pobA